MLIMLKKVTVSAPLFINFGSTNSRSIHQPALFAAVNQRIYVTIKSSDTTSILPPEQKLPVKDFQWYLDLRKYGSVPHSGFGVGLERLVGWLCGVPHVRETIPFPRMINRIKP